MTPCQQSTNWIRSDLRPHHGHQIWPNAVRMQRHFQKPKMQKILFQILQQKMQKLTDSIAMAAAHYPTNEGTSVSPKVPLRLNTGQI